MPFFGPSCNLLHPSTRSDEERCVSGSVALRQPDYSGLRNGFGQNCVVLLTHEGAPDPLVDSGSSTLHHYRMAAILKLLESFGSWG